MLFKTELIDKITAEKKTQTRRPRKDGETLWINHLGEPACVTHNGRTKVKIGNDYAVQPGRGKSSVWWNSDTGEWRCVEPHNAEANGFRVLRIQVLDIRKEDVREISVRDAQAEGFFNRIGFWQTWCSFYDWTVAENIGTSFDVRKLLQERPDSLYQAWAYTFEVLR